MQEIDISVNTAVLDFPLKISLTTISLLSLAVERLNGKTLSPVALSVTGGKVDEFLPKPP